LFLVTDGLPMLSLTYQDVMLHTFIGLDTEIRVMHENEQKHKKEIQSCIRISLEPDRPRPGPETLFSKSPLQIETRSAKFYRLAWSIGLGYVG
jgi:hypothetical protein